MKRSGFKSRGKALRPVSKKRAAFHASQEGQDELAHMGDVRSQPCVVCGTTFNVKAHHCKDKPPAGEHNPYVRESCGGRKSSGYDTIPLCEPRCHNPGPLSYHTNPREWRERNGADYTYIEPTRRRVQEMRESIDF